MNRPIRHRSTVSRREEMYSYRRSHTHCNGHSSVINAPTPRNVWVDAILNHDAALVPAALFG